MKLNELKEFKETGNFLKLKLNPKYRTLKFHVLNLIKDKCLMMESYTDNTLLCKYQDNGNKWNQFFELDLNNDILLIDTSYRSNKKLKTFYDDIGYFEIAKY